MSLHFAATAPKPNRYFHDLDWRSCGLVILAGFILLIPVIANGFPFIFQDSADYLIFTPHLYRSPFYGLFIAFFHLNRFIWAPVAAQALIGSHLIYTLMTVLRLPRPAVLLVPVSAFLTFFSTLPFFIGFIMPDILTSYMFLALYLVGFHFFEFSILKRLYLLLLCCVTIASHLSHLTMAVGLIVLFIPLARFIGYSWPKIGRHLIILLVPIVLNCCAYAAFNIAVFHQVSLSPAGQTFLLANLIEYGPARTYLQSACPDAGYKICAEVDHLPSKADQFLWQSGYLDKLGGFAGMAAESPVIVHAVLKEQRQAVIDMVARNFLSALGSHTPDADLTPNSFPRWTSIYTVIGEKFGPGALSAFRSSAQLAGTIPHAVIDRIDSVMVPVALVLLIVAGICAFNRRRHDLVAFAVFTLCGVFGDAFFCAAVSGVHDRYQARVTWLLLFAAFVLITGLASRKTAMVPATDLDRD